MYGSFSRGMASSQRTVGRCVVPWRRSCHRHVLYETYRYILGQRVMLPSLQRKHSKTRITRWNTVKNIHFTLPLYCRIMKSYSLPPSPSPRMSFSKGGFAARSRKVPGCHSICLRLGWLLQPGTVPLGTRGGRSPANRGASS